MNAPTPDISPAPVLASISLARREVVRFLRQPSRVVGALATPLVFWLLIGSGMGRSFRPTDVAIETSFLEYFFPGAIALTVLFASIFSSISVIQDRNDGFLQAALVAPVPRMSVVMGKVGGGAILALLQGAAFLLLAPLAGYSMTPVSVLAALMWIALMSVSLTALGFAFAWRMDSVQGFHSIMNLVIMPLWLLSGSFFPPSGASTVMAWVMRANPLTYAVAGLRRAMSPETAGDLPSQPICLAVSIGFGAVTLLASQWVVGRRSRTKSR